MLRIGQFLFLFVKLLPDILNLLILLDKRFLILPELLDIL